MKILRKWLIIYFHCFFLIIKNFIINKIIELNKDLDNKLFISFYKELKQDSGFYDEETSKVCVQIAKEYAKKEAIGFIEFTQGAYSYSNIYDSWYLHANTDKHYTSSELYEIYLTTKTK